MKRALQTSVWGMIGFLLFIGAVFGVVGATMAGLITYNEYARYYPDRRPAVNAAMQTAVVTWLFFLSVSAVVGAFLDRLQPTR